MKDKPMSKEELLAKAKDIKLRLECKKFWGYVPWDKFLKPRMGFHNPFLTYLTRHKNFVETNDVKRADALRESFTVACLMAIDRVWNPAAPEHMLNKRKRLQLSRSHHITKKPAYGLEFRPDFYREMILQPQMSDHHVAVLYRAYLKFEKIYNFNYHTSKSHPPIIEEMPDQSLSLSWWQYIVPTGITVLIFKLWIHCLRMRKKLNNGKR